ncbi:hypothetical protein EGP98_00050, partial [bacterium]|nr:hypothetical protein [bacterium]
MQPKTKITLVGNNKIVNYNDKNEELEKAYLDTIGILRQTVETDQIKQDKADKKKDNKKEKDKKGKEKKEG